MEISLHLRKREIFSFSLSLSLAFSFSRSSGPLTPLRMRAQNSTAGTVLPDNRVFNIVARCCIYSTKNHSFSPRARMIRGISCASTPCRLTRIKCRPEGATEVAAEAWEPSVTDGLARFRSLLDFSSFARLLLRPANLRLFTILFLSME